jgi:hypothetical protein
MGLGTWAHAISTVKVGTCRDMVDCLVNVDEVEKAEERQRIERAVEEPGVLLPPLVASECTCLTVLEIGDI